MLKLGLLLGGIVGALVATLFAKPKDEDTVILDTEPRGVIDQLKLQVRDAQIAAQAEAKVKEAEMLADYEASRHTRNHTP